MAARIVHYALANLILQQNMISDDVRFLAGQLIPDAIERNNSSHAQSHFKVTYKETMKMFDTKAFLNKYKSEIEDDSLYLGYYLHLVQDAVYRDFLYSKDRFEPLRSNKFAEELHNDYKLLNQHIIKKYNLDYRLIEADIDCLNGIYEFDFDKLLLELKNDFEDDGMGSTIHLREDSIERYIALSLEICIKELQALQANTSIFNCENYAWNR